MAKPFRLYICSDIHASERTWRKFVNAMKANVYKVDAAVIAGDLTGKALVAVVNGDHKGAEAWTATVLGRFTTKAAMAHVASPGALLRVLPPVSPKLHREPLHFETVHLTQRSYK